MKFLSYLGALLGSLAGVTFGVLMAFPEESTHDIHFRMSDMHPAVVVGIVVSGVALALLYVFSEKKAKGFWFNLLVMGLVGLFYPYLLQMLYLAVVVFVLFPLMAIWYFKGTLFIIACISLVVWGYRSTLKA